MKTQNDVRIPLYDQEDAAFDAAIGYYSLGMLDEAEEELNKIDASIAAHSVLLLALRLGISYSRSDWNKMKIIARKLIDLDPCNPKWVYSDGYATARIDAMAGKED